MASFEAYVALVVVVVVSEPLLPSTQSMEDADGTRTSLETAVSCQEEEAGHV